MAAVMHATKGAVGCERVLDPRREGPHESERKGRGKFNRFPASPHWNSGSNRRRIREGAGWTALWSHLGLAGNAADGTQFHVVGVMPEGFRELEPVAAPDFWAPLSLFDQFRPGQQGREGSAGLFIVGRLKPGLARAQALARLLVWDSQRAAERSGERPATSLVPGLMR